MASSINASTSGAGGVITTADNTGILNLQTGGTTAITVDASQNVGIGTTSPFSAAGYKSLTINGSTTGILAIQANGTNSCYLYSDGSALNFKGLQNIPLDFYTNDTYRMRINSSGVLLINATSNIATVTSDCKLQVQNSAAEWCGAFSNNASSGGNYGVYVKYPNAAPNNTTSEFLYCADSGAIKGTIRSNGGLANYSANNVNLSDAREKTNIELAGSYLDKICAIPVKTFNYIDQNMEEDGGLTLGVIAQDVQAVAPELVTESNWGTKEEPKERLSIYQTDLQYALMKCIQEQQTIINELKARIETLEAK